MEVGAPPDLRSRSLSLFEGNFPYALALLDAEFQILWVSNGYTSLLGYPNADVVGSNALDFVHPDDLDQLLSLVTQMVSAAVEMIAEPSVYGMVELPARVRSASEAWLPMAVTGRVYDETGSLLVCLRLAVDRHSMDAVLDCLGGDADIDATSSALVNLLMAQFRTTAAWLVHDTSGAAVVVGPAETTGTEDPSALMSSLRERGSLPAMQLTSDRWIVPVLSVTGETLVAVFIVDSTGIGTPNPYDQHVLARTVSLASLAFTKAQAERTLHRAATTDHLTDVLNRRELESRIMRLALNSEAFPATLLYIDVDAFKSINDTHGHETGDAVLRTIARRLSNAVRAHDSVGRLGGDEFAVLCPNLGDSECRDMQARLAHAIGAPITIDDVERPLTVSASIGSALADHEDDLVTLIRRADAAMYQRKHSRPVVS